jgi:hypothetical protein
MSTGRPGAASVDGVMQADEVAKIVLAAMEAERFLILSHDTVKEYEQRKVAGRDRWIGGMRRLRNKIYGDPAEKRA